MGGHLKTKVDTESPLSASQNSVSLGRSSLRTTDSDRSGSVKTSIPDTQKRKPGTPALASFGQIDPQKGNCIGKADPQRGPLSKVGYYQLPASPPPHLEQTTCEGSTVP